MSSFDMRPNTVTAAFMILILISVEEILSRLAARLSIGVAWVSILILSMTVITLNPVLKKFRRKVLIWAAGVGVVAPQTQRQQHLQAMRPLLPMAASNKLNLF